MSSKVSRVGGHRPSFGIEAVAERPRRGSPLILAGTRAQRGQDLEWIAVVDAGEGEQCRGKVACKGIMTNWWNEVVGKLVAGC